MAKIWLTMVAVGVVAGNLFADQTQLTEEQKIVHVLNRLGFGPRPGDVERVRQLGLDKYIAQQLHPATIKDDAVQQKLKSLTVLQMSAEALSADFREEQKERKAFQEARAAATNAALRAELPRPNMQERIAHPSARGVGELQADKIIRAVESERQFQEVIVDFWSNHFNIDVRKNACRVLKVVDERDVIRAYAFGKFRDLLGASAQSPAMLVYLDNALNSAPRPPRGESAQPRRGGLNENYAREIMELHTLGVDGGYTQKDVTEVARCFTGWGIEMGTGRFHFGAFRHDNGPKSVLGHVIAPDGGQKDGEKVLDILCQHPSTAKFIATKLCRRLVADDPPPALVARVAKVFTDTEGDLPKVYAAIVTSPEFYSPAALRSKIKSPFEYAVSAVRALGGKVTPAETKLQEAMETMTTFGRGERLARHNSLNQQIQQMGQTLFAYQAPTGWPEDSRKWVSTGALISRLNFAIALTGRNVGDVTLDLSAGAMGVDSDQPGAVIDRLATALLHGPLTDGTRQTLQKQAAGNGSTVDIPQLTALILGAPEFQRR
jgi:uncharacterized protein (DUF1800 family)